MPGRLRHDLNLRVEQRCMIALNNSSAKGIIKHILHSRAYLQAPHCNISPDNQAYQYSKRQSNYNKRLSGLAGMFSDLPSSILSTIRAGRYEDRGQMPPLAG